MTEMMLVTWPSLGASARCAACTTRIAISPLAVTATLNMLSSSRRGLRTASLMPTSSAAGRCAENLIAAARRCGALAGS